MTGLLERAFSEASKLPTTEQEALATWILEELAAERSWSDAFAKSGKVLDQLAKEALEEYREGRTKALDPDDL